jgi:selenide,water dikinase
MDDAALVNAGAQGQLVFTVDFITPIVDSPESYGAIAAANSISDVYAMGGDPRVALAVCGFPDDKVEPETLARIMQGGSDKAAEAGCAIVGGHTVLDPELKYGLAVLGSVAPERALKQTRAQAGDRLVLTKAIGTGIAAQAIKKGSISESELDEVVLSMTTLNAAAKDAALAADAHAATDVTGFGLLGHLHNMAGAAEASIWLDASAVPTFSGTGARVAAGMVPGGSRNNLAYVEATTRFSDRVDEDLRLVLADAQTSGGLVISVAADNEALLLDELAQRDVAVRAVIGEVRDGAAGTIEVGTS